MFLKTVYSDAINPSSNLGFEHLDYNSCITEKMKLLSVLLTMPNDEFTLTFCLTKHFRENMNVMGLPV